MGPWKEVRQACGYGGLSAPPPGKECTDRLVIAWTPPHHLAFWRWIGITRHRSRQAGEGRGGMEAGREEGSE